MLIVLVMRADQVITICGSDRGFKHGKCLGEAKFSLPYALAVDPLNPNCFFIGDESSVRYCTPETVTLVAGGEESDFADGRGSNARFSAVSSLLCTASRDRLYVADFCNNRVRMIDLTGTVTVTTVAGDGELNSKDGCGVQCSIHYPRQMTFDRSPSLSPPVSVVFILSHGALRRFDLVTCEMTTCQLVPVGRDESPITDLHGIDSTPSGHLILSCMRTDSIYLFDPYRPGSGLELLAGSEQPSSLVFFADGPGNSAVFNQPIGLVVVDSEQCVYIADCGNSRIRRMTLPPHVLPVLTEYRTD